MEFVPAPEAGEFTEAVHSQPRTCFVAEERLLHFADDFLLGDPVQRESSAGSAIGVEDGDDFSITAGFLDLAHHDVEVGEDAFFIAEHEGQRGAFGADDGHEECAVGFAMRDDAEEVGVAVFLGEFGREFYADCPWGDGISWGRRGGETEEAGIGFPGGLSINFVDTISLGFGDIHFDTGGHEAVGGLGVDRERGVVEADEHGGVFVDLIVDELEAGDAFHVIGGGAAEDGDIIREDGLDTFDGESGIDVDTRGEEHDELGFTLGVVEFFGELGGGFAGVTTIELICIGEGDLAFISPGHHDGDGAHGFIGAFAADDAGAGAAGYACVGAVFTESFEEFGVIMAHGEVDGDEVAIVGVSAFAGVEDGGLDGFFGAGETVGGGAEF